MLIEVTAEPRGKVVWGKVGQAAKRRRQDQLSAAPQQARELLDRRQGIRDVLDDFGTQDRIKGTVRLRNGGDIADDVDLLVIVRAGLQAAAVSLTVVAREILGNVAQV